MSLDVTQVSQCLDKKLLIAGYEVPDLILIFAILSILNFALGWTGYRLLLVWLPSILVAAILRFGKKGRPDNYLIHLLKFQLTPKYFSAFLESNTFQSPPSLNRKRA